MKRRLDVSFFVFLKAAHFLSFYLFIFLSFYLFIFLWFIFSHFAQLICKRTLMTTFLQKRC
ncbi:hypothetical protein CWB72_06540 [Pseudoalteromonas phenolica]|nr:hypothetical protein CWB72_06540 [Pseudoalteromonas phenolica]